MSSYVAKSKKTFQPKAPVRRGAAPASNTPSVRNIQEPRISETPQQAAIDASASEPVNVGDSARAVNLVASRDNAQHEANNVASTETQASLARAASAADIDTRLPRHVSVTNTAGIPAKSPVSATIITPAPSQASGLSPAASLEEHTRGEQTSTKPFHVNAETVDTPETAINITTESSKTPPVLPTPDATQSNEIEAAVIGDGEASQEEGANALLQLSQADALTRHNSERGDDRIVAPTSNDTAGVDNQRGSSENGMQSRETHSRANVAKAKSERKRKAPILVQEEEGYPEDDVTERPSPAKKPRFKVKTSAKKVTKVKPGTRKAASHQDGSATPAATARKPKRRRQQDVPETAADEDVESEPEARRRRESTPEDAEEQQIDQDVQTMAELPSLRIGRLGERERLLRERDAKIQAQKVADAEIAARIQSYGDGGVPDDDQEAHEYLERQKEKEEKERLEVEESARIFEEQQEWTNTAPKRGSKRQRADEESEEDDQANAGEMDENGVPQAGMYNVVGGEILLNTNYRVKQKQKKVKIVERQENDITHQMNYGKHSRKERRFVWTEEAVDRFYEGLQTFGASLDMIATIIPGTSRQNIKSKWLKEQKLDPDRCNDALKPENRLKMDLKRIEELRGKALVDTTEFYAESQRRETELRDEKEQARQDAEAQLKGAGHTDDEDEDGNEGEGQDSGNTDKGNVEDEYDEVDNPGQDDAVANEEVDDASHSEPEDPNGVIESIEDPEDSLNSAAARKRGGKSKVTRGAGRGRGRARGRGSRGSVRGRS